MPLCKFCGKPFDWGSSDGRWVPLAPLNESDGLDRQYQDENGALRAEHRQLCIDRGGPTVRVSRLARPILASEVIGPVKLIDPDTGEVTNVAI
jgi:hypothetical protein